MDAFIVAGGIPKPGEPLYSTTQGRPKALLELAGKSMIQWVVDALDGARRVDRIAVVGLDADVGLRSDKPLSFHPGRGGFFDNVMAGRHVIHEIHPLAHLALGVSSDIPALTPECVDWLIGQTLDEAHEVYFVVIRKEVMETAFPGAGRSYLRMDGMDLCGADMHVMTVSQDPNEEGVWRELAEARKRVFRMVKLFGLGFFARVALRRISIAEAERHVSGRLGLKGRVLLSPYAEIGMDADKPHQLEMLRAHLEKREADGAPGRSAPHRA